MASSDRLIDRDVLLACRRLRLVEQVDLGVVRRHRVAQHRCGDRPRLFGHLRGRRLDRDLVDLPAQGRLVHRRAADGWRLAGLHRQCVRRHQAGEEGPHAGERHVDQLQAFPQRVQHGGDRLDQPLAVVGVELGLHAPDQVGHRVTVTSCKARLGPFTQGCRHQHLDPHVEQEPGEVRLDRHLLERAADAGGRVDGHRFALLGVVERTPGARHRIVFPSALLGQVLLELVERRLEDGRAFVDRQRHGIDGLVDLGQVARVLVTLRMPADGRGRDPVHQPSRRLRRRDEQVDVRQRNLHDRELEPRQRDLDLRRNLFVLVNAVEHHADQFDSQLVDLPRRLVGHLLAQLMLVALHDGWCGVAAPAGHRRQRVQPLHFVDRCEQRGVDRRELDRSAKPDRRGGQDGRDGGNGWRSRGNAACETLRRGAQRMRVRVVEHHGWRRNGPADATRNPRVHPLEQGGQQLLGGGATRRCRRRGRVRGQAGARGCCGHRPGSAGRLRRRLGRGRGGADTGSPMTVADRFPVRHALLLELLVQRRIHGEQGLLQRHLERLDDRLALLALEPELVHRAAQRAAVTQRMEWILASPELRQPQRAGDAPGQRTVFGIGGVAQPCRDAVDHRLLFHLVVIDQRQAPAARARRFLRHVAAVQMVLQRCVHFLVERREERRGEHGIADQDVARRALQRAGHRQVELDCLHRVLCRGLQVRFERPARGLPHAGQGALRGGASGGSTFSIGVHDSSRGALLQ